MSRLITRSSHNILLLTKASLKRLRDKSDQLGDAARIRSYCSIPPGYGLSKPFGRPRRANRSTRELLGICTVGVMRIVCPPRIGLSWRSGGAFEGIAWLAWVGALGAKRVSEDERYCGWYDTGPI
jgi:hypothetical protein